MSIVRIIPGLHANLKEAAKNDTRALFSKRKPVPTEKNPIEIYDINELETLLSFLQNENTRTGKDHIIAEWVSRWPGPYVGRYERSYGLGLLERKEVTAYFKKYGNGLLKELDSHISSDFYGEQELRRAIEYERQRTSKWNKILGEIKGTTPPTDQVLA